MTTTRTDKRQQPGILKSVQACLKRSRPLLQCRNPYPYQTEAGVIWTPDLRGHFPFMRKGERAGLTQTNHCTRIFPGVPIWTTIFPRFLRKREEKGIKMPIRE